MTKSCPHCGLDKPATEFGRNRALPDGLSFYCKGCTRTKNNRYYRQRREARGFNFREPDASPAGFKRCSRCRETKPVDAFHAHRTQSGGFSTYCKECRKVMGADTHIKRTYGLSRVELDALVESQGGLCAICAANPAVHVDHDHATGKIRGVLCFTCNVALGHLKDDVALFRKAIGYLERTQ